MQVSQELELRLSLNLFAVDLVALFVMSCLSSVGEDVPVTEQI